MIRRKAAVDSALLDARWLELVVGIPVPQFLLTALMAAQPGRRGPAYDPEVFERHGGCFALRRSRIGDDGIDPRSISTLGDEVFPRIVSRKVGTHQVPGIDNTGALHRILGALVNDLAAMGVDAWTTLGPEDLDLLADALESRSLYKQVLPRPWQEHRDV